MSDVLRRYPLISVLAIVAGLLVVVLGLEYAATSSLREHATGASKVPPAPVTAKLLPAVPPVNPEQEYAEMGDRPLFISTRHPAPALAQAATGAMTKGQFVLTGVISAGGTKIALLREKSSGRVVRVEQGKDLNGVTVAQIDPEQVTLAQGGDQEVIPLLVSKGSPAAATVPAPGAPSAPSGGPFSSPVSPNLAPGANPAARAVAVPPPSPEQTPAPGPAVNPNTLFGPRPGGLTPGNSYIPPPDPAAGTTPSSQATPLTPEELLARRRARRTQ